MGNKIKKPTIKDVAKMACVSPSTVSRVISNNKSISKSTSDRVKKVIKELNYTTNYNARSLAISNSQTIAIIIDRGPGLSLTNTFFVEILQSIASELGKYDKELLLVFSSDDKDESKKVKKLAKSNRIDGLIKLSIRKDDSTVEFIRESKFPAVIIGKVDDKKIAYVDNDNVEAMYRVCKYMVDQGKSKIAFVGGSLKYLVTQNRLLGYKKALYDNKLFFSDDYIYEVEFSKEDAYNKAHEILKDSYDAIVCTDDLIALGICERARKEGNDILISGFNNSIERRLSNSKIPTVDINVKRLGKEAVNLLMGIIDKGKKAKGILVETTFIAR